MPIFADLAGQSESSRIRILGRMASVGLLTAFVTDSTPGKAERFVEKLLRKYRGLQVLEMVDGPVPKTVVVRLCLNGE